MSLAVPYENVHDAQMRLQNTVVLYDGKPVYITQVGGKGAGDPKDDVFRVYASLLPYDGRGGADEAMRKFISSKKFDMAPFPMGFMNVGGVAYYCSRMPRRQQRQGLSEGTFNTIAVGLPQMGRLGFGDVISRKQFVDCIEGKYPEFGEARAQIENGDANSVGFSRAFALVMDPDLNELMYLYHKKEKVGFIMGDEVKLSKAGKCLVEALREEGVRC